MNGCHHDGHMMLVLAPSSLSREEIGLKRPVSVPGENLPQNLQGGTTQPLGRKWKKVDFACLNWPVMGWAESSDHESSVIID